MKILRIAAALVVASLFLVAAGCESGESPLDRIGRNQCDMGAVCLRLYVGDSVEMVKDPAIAAAAPGIIQYATADGREIMFSGDYKISSRTR